MLLFGCLVACPSILPRHLCYRCSPRIKSNVVGRFKKRHPISPFPAMTLWQNWTWLVVSSTSPYTPIYSVVFPLSTIPYVLFLRGLWKKKSVPVVAKIGFSYLLVFVLFSIVGSLLAQNLYHETLSNVDWIHGCAEQFLSVTTFSILLGYRLALDSMGPKKKQ